MSAAPRSVPSSWNWTRWTSTPNGPTLALTWIVPPTVDPSAGEVTVTIRPLSCAEAGDGEKDAQPSTTATVIGRTTFAQNPTVLRFIAPPFASEDHQALTA